jgi:hypothetical protein
MTVTSGATSFSLGSFDPATCSVSCSGFFGAGPESGKIDDTFTFTTSTGALITAASATNSFSIPAQAIANFTIQLWSGTPGQVGDSLLGTGTGGFSGSHFQFAGGVSDTIAPGSYFFEVSGINGGAPTTYSGSYSFSAATPLPAALPLFASGLAGLWAWQRRRKTRAQGPEAELGGQQIA